MPDHIFSADPIAPQTPTHVEVSDRTVYQKLKAQRARLNAHARDAAPNPAKVADDYQEYLHILEIADASGYSEHARDAVADFQESGDTEAVRDLLSLERGSIDRNFADAGIKIRNYLDRSTKEGMQAHGAGEKEAAMADAWLTNNSDPNAVEGETDYRVMIESGLYNENVSKAVYERGREGLLHIRSSVELDPRLKGEALASKEKFVRDIWGATQELGAYSSAGKYVNVKEVTAATTSLADHFARRSTALAKTNGRNLDPTETIDGRREAISTLDQLVRTPAVKSNWTYLHGILDGSNSTLSSLLNPDADSNLLVKGFGQLGTAARQIQTQVARIAGTGSHAAEIANALLYARARTENLGVFKQDAAMDAKATRYVRDLEHSFDAAAETFLNTGDLSRAMPGWLARTSGAFGQSPESVVATLSGPDASPIEMADTRSLVTTIQSVTPVDRKHDEIRLRVQGVSPANLPDHPAVKAALAGSPDMTAQLAKAVRTYGTLTQREEHMPLETVFNGGVKDTATMSDEQRFEADERREDFENFFARTQKPSAFLSVLSLPFVNSYDEMIKTGFQQVLRGKSIRDARIAKVTVGDVKFPLSDLVTFDEIKALVAGDAVGLTERFLIERALTEQYLQLGPGSVPERNPHTAKRGNMGDRLSARGIDQNFPITVAWKDGTSTINIDLLNRETASAEMAAAAAYHPASGESLADHMKSYRESWARVAAGEEAEIAIGKRAQLADAMGNLTPGGNSVLTTYRGLQALYEATIPGAPKTQATAVGLRIGKATALRELQVKDAKAFWTAAAQDNKSATAAQQARTIQLKDRIAKEQADPDFEGTKLTDDQMHAEAAEQVDKEREFFNKAQAKQ